MAALKWIAICFLLVFIQTVENAGKIHRAMSPSRMKSKIAVNTTTTNNADRTVTDYTPWFYAIPATFLVGLTGIFPLLVIPVEAGHKLREGVSADRLKLLLSFAVGGLLGDVFLHLLPEAYGPVKGVHTDEQHLRIGLWIIGGLLSFLVLEKVFQESDEKEENSCKLKTDSEEMDHKNQNGQICNGPVPNGTAQNGHTVKDGHTMKNSYIKNGHAVKNGYMKNGDTVKNGYIENGHTNGHIENGHTNGCVENGHLQNGLTDVRKRTKDSEILSEQDRKYPSTEDSETSDESEVKVVGYLNLLANCIDNFTHGLAVSGSFLVSTKVGMLTTFAILLHEIPHEVGDFAILLKSGFRRWDAACGQIMTATGGLFGAIFGLVCSEAGDSTYWVLPFTSGGFIYIALVTIVPELLEENRPWESIKQVLCLTLGITAMGLVSLIH